LLSAIWLCRIIVPLLLFFCFSFLLFESISIDEIDREPRRKKKPKKKRKTKFFKHAVNMESKRNGREQKSNRDN
jgi:membrane-anchored glycerophosphoryl diester phosphodiesterase (GDPDase)